MISGFALHPEAFEDIDEIRDFLVLRSTGAADRAVTEIFGAIRNTLVPFPKLGHRRADLTSRPLLFAVVLNQYLIAYAPDEKPLWVVAVIDGRRSVRVMAAILRGRE